jgi:hypothetical protein
MLGSNPGLLRLRHWLSDALTTRLDLIHRWRRSIVTGVQFHVPYKKKKAPSKNPNNPKNPAGGNSLVFFLLCGWSPARNCQINLKIQGSVWLGGKSGAGGNYSERENESERQIKRKLNENLSIKGKRSGMKAGWTHWMGQCSRKQLKVFQMC